MVFGIKKGAWIFTRAPFGSTGLTIIDVAEVRDYRHRLGWGEELVHGHRHLRGDSGVAHKSAGVLAGELVVVEEPDYELASAQAEWAVELAHKSAEVLAGESVVVEEPDHELVLGQVDK